MHPDGEFVDYIIGFGKPEVQDVFSEDRVSPRFSVRELVFKNHLDSPADLTELENYGLFDLFSSIRFAPSHINAQPFSQISNIHSFTDLLNDQQTFFTTNEQFKQSVNT